MYTFKCGVQFSRYNVVTVTLYALHEDESVGFELVRERDFPDIGEHDKRNEVWFPLLNEFLWDILDECYVSFSEDFSTEDTDSMFIALYEAVSKVRLYIKNYNEEE